MNIFALEYFFRRELGTPIELLKRMRARDGNELEVRLSFERGRGGVIESTFHPTVFIARDENDERMKRIIIGCENADGVFNCLMQSSGPQTLEANQQALLASLIQKQNSGDYVISPVEVSDELSLQIRRYDRTALDALTLEASAGTIVSIEAKIVAHQLLLDEDFSVADLTDIQDWSAERLSRTRLAWRLSSPVAPGQTAPDWRIAVAPFQEECACLTELSLKTRFNTLRALAALTDGDFETAYDRLIAAIEALLSYLSSWSALSNLYQTIGYGPIWSGLAESARTNASEAAEYLTVIALSLKGHGDASPLLNLAQRIESEIWDAYAESVGLTALVQALKCPAAA